jgi:hypothetical protein
MDGMGFLTRAVNFVPFTKNGAPGGNRTPDPLLRRQTLYPTELRARSDYFLSLIYITQPARATKFGCKWAILGATELVLEK